MLSCQIANPQDCDREDLPHMHIRVLSKTHILQAHKEFDGTVKNKIANKNIITFPSGAKVMICFSYKRCSAYQIY